MSARRRTGSNGRSATWRQIAVGLMIGCLIGSVFDLWFAGSAPVTGRATAVVLTHPEAVPAALSGPVLRLEVVTGEWRGVRLAAAALGPDTFYTFTSTSTSADRAVRDSAADAARAVRSLTGVDVSGADPQVETGTTGPSAGLAYALALLDAAGPGPLIPAGAVIAATGTIDAAGNVGPVGGYVDKFAAADAAGATVLFGPRDTPAAVAAHYPGRFHPVATLADAVHWLCTHGGADSACRQ